jgi:endo-1,4-beta-xylanase
MKALSFSPVFAGLRRLSAGLHGIVVRRPVIAPLRTGTAVAALALMFGAGAAGEAGDATLGSAAAGSGRYFGAAIDPDALDEKPYRDLASAQLTSVTPENAMKWESVEPSRGQFEWREADALVAFAKAHGQKVRGHTLVWHSQLPPWLTQSKFSPGELKDLMVDHIAAEAGRYRGQVYAWDVVNEPFADDGSWRESIWYEAMGPAYVAIALRAARAADPDAKLYVNDYNVETDGPKMRALLGLVASLKRDGVPIDGVGLQSHFVAGAAPADFSAVMAEFGSFGVDVAVTELDLRIPLPADQPALKAQAAGYGSVVRACRSTPRCVGVTTWGITDDRSWIPSFFSGYGAALPFDENYRPKPAVAAIIEAFGWKGP